MSTIRFQMSSILEVCGVGKEKRDKVISLMEKQELVLVKQDYLRGLNNLKDAIHWAVKED